MNPGEYILELCTERRLPEKKGGKQVGCNGLGTRYRAGVGTDF